MSKVTLNEISHFDQDVDALHKIFGPDCREIIIDGKKLGGETVSLRFVLRRLATFRNKVMQGTVSIS